MHLTDYQTYRQDGNSGYWDGGPKKIKAIMDEHLAVCKDNWVCNRLRLRTATVEAHMPDVLGEGEGDSDSESELNNTNTTDASSKQSIGFLLNGV